VIYIAVGVLGFVIIHLCDPVAIKRLPFLKPITWGLGVSLVAFATVNAFLWPAKLSLPDWSWWLGWVLMFSSALLVAYSLFINLPFRKTYILPGVGERLIKSGFYALVRHPGVLWSVIFILSLVLVSRSQLALIASPIFVGLDLLAVILQDTLFFGKMFPGYDRYKEETPMLIPNVKSMRAFADSLKRKSPPTRSQGERNDFELS
jgi:protein-S-isoprenylcysteine O-methyltransferase Ste14